MGKFKTGLLHEYQHETQIAQVQSTLKAKHGIDDAQIVVVEKSNMAKFLMRVIASIIRVCAMIMLCVLAVIGVVALLYPLPRAELLRIWEEIVTKLLPFLSL